MQYKSLNYNGLKLDEQLSEPTRLFWICCPPHLILRTAVGADV
jgi:hypothetical protein